MNECYSSRVCVPSTPVYDKFSDIILSTSWWHCFTWHNIGFHRQKRQGKKRTNMAHKQQSKHMCIRPGFCKYCPTIHSCDFNIKFTINDGPRLRWRPTPIPQYFKLYITALWVPFSSVVIVKSKNWLWISSKLMFNYCAITIWGYLLLLLMWAQENVDQVT